jgi:hypothetical protein
MRILESSEVRMISGGTLGAANVIALGRGVTADRFGIGTRSMEEAPQGDGPLSIPSKIGPVDVGSVPGNGGGGGGGSGSGGEGGGGRGGQFVCDQAGCRFT